MCDHCGCGIPEQTHSHDHDHEHGHDHGHTHENPSKLIEVQQSILSQNQLLAERNRGFFKARKLFVLNLLSSPGSGKTSLIERTLMDRGDKMKIGVIVGDLQTENDAIRIRSKGAPAVQITTGTTCHLDAHMVEHALDKLNLDGIKILFIENVGNLVCPASFDLGEAARVVLLSVTEGEDKPLKYPTIFLNADLVIINKTDIAEAVQFNRKAALENIRKVAPKAKVVELSARTGAGMEAWYAFLETNSAR
jgi:hydrogenase nickel incorporation protein HypB